jgi:hypothetical protein
MELGLKLAGLLAAVLLAIAIAGPELPVKREGVRACAVLEQRVLVETLEATVEPRGYVILYYQCGSSGCSDELSEQLLEGDSGIVDLGYSLIHLPLAVVEGFGPLPPTWLKAVEPGVLEAAWVYPGLRIRALIVVEAKGALVYAEKGLPPPRAVASPSSCSLALSSWPAPISCSSSIVEAKSISLVLRADGLTALKLVAPVANEPGLCREGVLVESIMLRYLLIAAAAALAAASVLRKLSGRRA